MFCLFVLLLWSVIRMELTVYFFTIFCNSLFVRLSYIFSDVVGRLYKYMFITLLHTIVWLRSCSHCFLYPSKNGEFRLFFSCYSFPSEKKCAGVFATCNIREISSICSRNIYTGKCQKTTLAQMENRKIVPTPGDLQSAHRMRYHESRTHRQESRWIWRRSDYEEKGKWFLWPTANLKVNFDFPLSCMWIQRKGLDKDTVVPLHTVPSPAKGSCWKPPCLPCSLTRANAVPRAVGKGSGLLCQYKSLMGIKGNLQEVCHNQCTFFGGGSITSYY